MPRKTIKTVSNEPEEFIPESHRDLDRNAPNMLDRPLVFVGVKTNRDQQWALQDYIELKDRKNPDKGVKGMGDAYKYLWEHVILEVKNVVTDKGEFESMTGDDKNKLWYVDEIQDEVTEAITYFHYGSKLTEDEVKT